MIFTNQELGAILKMATVMADADGKVTNEETALMFVELVRFGVVSEDKVKIVINESSKLTSTEACSIISKMTNEEKKYVTAYLGAIICADGKIEDSEIKAWSLISSICDLPRMSIKEALEIINKP